MYPEKLNRYSKPCKELLIDYINHVNGKEFTYEQLEFGVPTLMESNGLSQVPMKFTSATGWDDTTVPLTYWRIEPSTIAGLSGLVIHSNDRTEEAILQAVFEQYNLLLEPELIVLIAIPEETTPTYANFRLEFKPEHLLFFGELLIHVRPAIELLGTTIRDLLELRDFYKDGNTQLPPVDVVIPNAELKLTNDPPFTYEQRRKYETALRAIPNGQLLVENTVVAEMLSIMTGDIWYADGTADGPFNLFGAKVVYNDLTGDNMTFSDGAYNYVFAIELGSRCSNLTGVLKIGYRYASPHIPNNQPYDRASVLPIFGNS